MADIKKQHPWRVCPLGEHYVREHIRHIKSGVTSVSEHCCLNKSKKEILTSLEIVEIYERNKNKIELRPGLSDVNWVKTLIYTESRFDENAINRRNPKNVAKGLMQITKVTHKIMTNSKGELKDICFDTDEKEQFNPNVSVAMGTRWIFQKKKLLKMRIKSEPTWEEVMWEYKGIYGDNSKKAKEIKISLREYYEKLISNK